MCYYVSGMGKKDLILTFDTLLEKLTHEEILEVLAHEAGHWKKKHILKTLVFTEILSLGLIFGAFNILQSDWLPQVFHISNGTFYTKLILLGFILSIGSFFFTPLSGYFSRRNEKEADRFSFELMGETRSMASALVKLTRDNLSNIYPHPLYSAFHYSHPPVLDRIKTLKKMEY